MRKYLLEGDGRSLLTRIASTNVQHAQLHSDGFRMLEDFLGPRDGLSVSRSIGAATADMEADSNHVQLEMFSHSEQSLGFRQLCSEFNT